MSGAKEIRTQIGSVNNTRKITSAMEMVAASKMRKAQDRMSASKPYAQRIRAVIGHLAHAASEFRHPYMDVREAKTVGIVLVSTDRGLCGGLNINLFKQALKEAKKWQDQGVKVRFCLVGQKASTFFKAMGSDVMAAATGLGDAPSMEQLIGSVKVVLDAYDAGELDRLILIRNEFVNTMSQEPRVEQVLPITAEESEEELSHKWDYIYEPNAEDLLNVLLVRYIESQIYQAVVENNACEQAARMVAMKAATDNAGDIIDELTLIYNKARQAAITQEISEIVSGAAAV